MRYEIRYLEVYLKDKVFLKSLHFVNLIKVVRELEGVITYPQIFEVPSNMKYKQGRLFDKASTVFQSTRSSF